MQDGVGTRIEKCLTPTDQALSPSDVSDNVWKTMDLKVRVVITGTVSYKVLEYILTKTTTLGIMQTLDAKYASKLIPMQIIHRGKLDNLRLLLFQKTRRLFLLESEKLCNLYKSAGGTLQKKKK